ncbi:MAG: hypothetical protein E2591_13195 [Achromobacter sp.]|nr:hypothetical protein [Achromobacter sp.]
MGGPAGEGDPHGAPLRGFLPPEGALPPLGRPGGRRWPPRCAAARLPTPPRGRLPLGAARRGKVTPTVRRIQAFQAQKKTRR